jgi:hypothetical protein
VLRAHEVGAIQGDGLDLGDLLVGEAFINLMGQVQNLVRTQPLFHGFDRDGDALALRERQGLQGLEHALLVDSWDFAGHGRDHLPRRAGFPLYTGAAGRTKGLAHDPTEIRTQARRGVKAFGITEGTEWATENTEESRSVLSVGPSVPSVIQPDRKEALWLARSISTPTKNSRPSNSGSINS